MRTCEAYREIARSQLRAEELEALMGDAVADVVADEADAADADETVTAVDAAADEASAPAEAADTPSAPADTAPEGDATPTQDSSQKGGE